MTCPFKYKKDYEIYEIADDSGIRIHKVKDEKPIIMCDLRNEECVGEDKCPIVKK